jgi:outer membrane protein assembly factor BamB
LFGFNAQGQKIIEKKIEIVFEQDYLVNGTETNQLKEIRLINNKILINSFYGYCGLETNGCINLLLAFDLNNFDSPLWTKKGGGFIGLGNNEAYYKERIPTWTGSYLALYALDLETGQDCWTKSLSSSDLSYFLIDNQNRIYFSQGSHIFGFDPSQIIDSSFDGGKIFSANGIYSGNTYPLAIGNQVLYFPTGAKILNISY